MHFTEKRRIPRSFRRAARVAARLLPAAVFPLLIFAFDAVGAAICTLLAVAIHEAGHAAAFFLLSGGKGGMTLRAACDGLRLKGYGTLSYRREIAVLAAGPCANLLVFCAAAIGGVGTFALLNLLTALSNLLPVEGYDGYRICAAILQARERGEQGLGILSLLCSALLAFSALFFIGRVNGGYWIFGIFFLGILRAMRS